MSEPVQLELFAPPQDVRVANEDPEEALVRCLDEALGGALGSVILTDNRSRILSARSLAGALEVRIHRSFVGAPESTLAEVARFLGGARGAARQRALATIREHFDRHGDHPRSPPRPRRRVLRQVGRCFDLAEIRDELNGRFFAGRLEVAITWGRQGGKRRRRRGQGISVRLGSYHDAERLVRIHPVLDHPTVPRYVVESVVYHEMLHAAVPASRGSDGRRRLHTPEFRRREQEFPEYERAERWIVSNLERLAKRR